MSNQYRATHPSLLGVYGEDVFDAEFSVTEEQDWLDRGLLELAPRPYRVLVGNYTVDGQPVAAGEVVELALRQEHEQALLDGGVLERTRRDAHPTVEVEPEPEPAPPARKARRKAATTEEE